MGNKSTRKSVNKIYTEYVDGSGVSFADWLKTEQVLYQSKERKSDFDLWLNRKYTLQGNNWKNFNFKEAAEYVKNNQENIIGVVSGIEELARKNKNAETLAEEEAIAEQEAEKDRFLGLPPVVTYGVGALIVLGVGFGIYKLVKRKKK
jgi:hypothetical protein